MSRKHTTGNFGSREELVSEIKEFIFLPGNNAYDVAQHCGISQGSVVNIIKEYGLAERVRENGKTRWVAKNEAR